MAGFELIMPKMGESIEEATITKWFVNEGDKVEEDDVLLEIATDKVDSEIPSPVEGIIKKILFKKDELVPVGTVIAIIDLDGEAASGTDADQSESSASEERQGPALPSVTDSPRHEDEEVKSTEDRFYSPLVRKIAGEEGISQHELDAIKGSGLNGRVQKKDVLAWLKSRDSSPSAAISGQKISEPAPATTAPRKDLVSEQQGPAPQVTNSPSGEEKDELVEMSRLRKLIAVNMLKSRQTSAHVTNMIEVDVTPVVNWRAGAKDDFLKKEGVKLTYLPVFLAATVRALKDFPQINASVEGDYIRIKKRINLGVAVALPDNNLIVPNIKDADTLNISGIARRVNELAAAARANKLGPDDISGGTFTVTNFGTFRNDIGTPIINQPEVAILAVGAIKKKPAVLETEHGDVIAIRHKMWLALTYDHRIIDGALGGAFLKRLGDYVESFNGESGIMNP